MLQESMRIHGPHIPEAGAGQVILHGLGYPVLHGLPSIENNKLKKSLSFWPAEVSFMPLTQ